LFSRRAAHGAELYRFANRALRDAGAAQDVVQDTFLRAWRAADRYDPQLASLRTWLFSIARNVIVDHHRARQHGPGSASSRAASPPMRRRRSTRSTS